LRITGGSLKGRFLNTPKSSKIRPTTDKTRSAIFSSLYDEVEGARVLDGFAGSGSFGVEAVSRGASFCLFIDQDISCIKSNMSLLEKGTYKVVKGDFLKIGAGFEKHFDIIFIDPPYGVYDPSEIVKTIKCQELLAKGGVLIYEESVRTDFSGFQSDLEIVKEKKYGETVIRYMR